MALNWKPDGGCMHAPGVKAGLTSVKVAATL